MLKLLAKSWSTSFVSLSKFSTKLDFQKPKSFISFDVGQETFESTAALRLGPESLEERLANSGRRFTGHFGDEYLGWCRIYNGRSRSQLQHLIQIDDGRLDFISRTCGRYFPNCSTKPRSCTCSSGGRHRHLLPRNGIDSVGSTSKCRLVNKRILYEIHEIISRSKKSWKSTNKRNSEWGSSLSGHLKLENLPCAQF